MTREEVIELGLEAGIWGTDGWTTRSTENLEKFAALVADYERTRIVDICDGVARAAYEKDTETPREENWREAILAVMMELSAAIKTLE